MNFSEQVHVAFPGIDARIIEAKGTRRVTFLGIEAQRRVVTSVRGNRFKPENELVFSGGKERIVH